MQQQLVAWSGHSWEQELQMRERGQSKTKCVIGGLALRVRKDKLGLITYQGKLEEFKAKTFKYADQKLCNFDEVEAARSNPPEGNSQMTDFYKTIKKGKTGHEEREEVDGSK